MPYISTETLVAGSLLVILALGWQYIPSGLPSSSSASSSSGSGASKAKKKNKKKTKGGAATSLEMETNTSGPVSVDDLPSQSINNNSKKRNKTLAEKLLPPEPKTKVDDMLAPEDRPPTLARVMKVSSKPSSTGTTTTTTAATDSSSSSTPSNQIKEDEKIERSSDEYISDSDEVISASGNEEFTPVQVEKKSKKVNDGWDVVTSKKKKPISISLSKSNPNTTSSTGNTNTALPLPISTKGQKKNAKKAEMKKIAREQDEADRQRRLKMHKKDLEREKINQLYTLSKTSTNSKSKINGNGTGNVNGSQASITPNGKLVWD